MQLFSHAGAQVARSQRTNKVMFPFMRWIPLRLSPGHGSGFGSWFSGPKQCFSWQYSSIGLALLWLPSIQLPPTQLQPVLGLHYLEGWVHVFIFSRSQPTPTKDFSLQYVCHNLSFITYYTMLPVKIFISSQGKLTPCPTALSRRKRNGSFSRTGSKIPVSQFQG